MSHAGRFFRTAAALDEAAVFDKVFSFLVADAAAIGVDLPVDLVSPTRFAAGMVEEFAFTEAFRFSVVGAAGLFTVASCFAGMAAGAGSTAGCFSGFFTVLGARNRLDMFSS